MNNPLTQEQADALLARAETAEKQSLKFAEVVVSAVTGLWLIPQNEFDTLYNEAVTMLNRSRQPKTAETERSASLDQALETLKKQIPPDAPTPSIRILTLKEAAQHSGRLAEGLDAVFPPDTPFPPKDCSHIP